MNGFQDRAIQRKIEKDGEIERDGEIELISSFFRILRA